MPEYSQYLTQLESFLKKDEELTKKKITTLEDQLEQEKLKDQKNKERKTALQDKIKTLTDQEPIIMETRTAVEKEFAETKQSYEELNTQYQKVNREVEQTNVIINELQQAQDQTQQEFELKEEALANQEKALEKLKASQKEDQENLAKLKAQQNLNRQFQHDQALQEVNAKTQTLAGLNREMSALKRGNKEFMTDVKVLIINKKHKHKKWLTGIGFAGLILFSLSLAFHLPFFYVLAPLLLGLTLLYLYFLWKYSVKAYSSLELKNMNTPVFSYFPEELLASCLDHLKLVEGGQFTMGGDEDSPVKATPHEVTLSDFYLSQYLVSQGDWNKVMGFNPGYFEGDDLPVENVSWHDAQAFIQRLNAQNHFSGTQKGIQFRLPTEAEWEYAAKGGRHSKRTSFVGSDRWQEVAWLEGNADHTPHPIGQKAPNELGLYDLAGNVWEWCQDYHADYERQSGEKDPKGPLKGKFCILRGGCWNSEPKHAFSSIRNMADPHERYYGNGFRLAASKVE